MNRAVFSRQDNDPEYSLAVIKNQILKTRILFFLFFSIFVLQTLVLTSLKLMDSALLNFVSPKLIILAPLYLLLGAISEFLYLRKLRSHQRSQTALNRNLAYLVTVLEISFPSVVLLAAATVIGSEGKLPIHEILNSPPFIIYFILIVLSSLNLDLRLSFLAGFTAALEYGLICAYLKLHFHVEEMIWLNIILKSVFILVTGVVTAFVCEKIRAAMVEALEAQHKLIYKLDGLVNEKTREITRQKSEIELQHAELSLKNNEILDSINYASRIQFTLLANRELMRKTLPKHFVFYQPKAIVSGDYFWLAEKAEFVFLAVCDSTGHGVPGAFMSLLNISYLNEAISQKNMLEPGEIFSYVRSKLIDQISGDGQKDGFDGILIRIKKGTGRICYAAANNSPLFLRDNNLVELERDRMPVGISEQMKAFRQFEIECESGDELYLYTDGFADQFGGPKGKKFKYKQLNDLLNTLYGTACEEQERVLRTSFEAWKGKLEQVDDVCVIGMRF
ncbi:MAG TPA: SpoIIE family protein phosphatase [Bacteroidia bacterium]|nr:SpoIIE family protein phosphatase [Bacteroidia bacterium]